MELVLTHHFPGSASPLTWKSNHLHLEGPHGWGKSTAARAICLALCGSCLDVGVRTSVKSPKLVGEMGADPTRGLDYHARVTVTRGYEEQEFTFPKGGSLPLYEPLAEVTPFISGTLPTRLKSLAWLTPAPPGYAEAAARASDLKAKIADYTNLVAIAARLGARTGVPDGLNELKTLYKKARAAVTSLEAAWLERASESFSTLLVGVNTVLDDITSRAALRPLRVKHHDLSLTFWDEDLQLGPLSRGELIAVGTAFAVVQHHTRAPSSGLLRSVLLISDASISHELIVALATTVPEDMALITTLVV
jgi:hypothetical protein